MIETVADILLYPRNGPSIVLLSVLLASMLMSTSLISAYLERFLDENTGFIEAAVTEWKSRTRSGKLEFVGGAPMAVVFIVIVTVIDQIVKRLHNFDRYQNPRVKP